MAAQKRPVQIVHVGIGRIHQRSRKEDQNQSRERPREQRTIQLRRFMIRQTDPQQPQVDQGYRSDEQRESRDVEDFERRENEL